MKNGILNHNFGYGNDCENVNKLELKDVSELKMYLNNALSEVLDAKVTNNIIYFRDGQKIEYLVED